MKHDLVEFTNKTMLQANRLLRQPANAKVRRELSEVYRSLSALNKQFKLEAISKASIEYLMNRIIQYISYDGYFNYYMCFYYLPNSVYNKNAEDLSANILNANTNISCFRCLIQASDLLNFSLDTSGNYYFFERGTRLVNAIRNFIKYPFEFDISALVYLALNYYQTICEYEACRDKTFKIHIPKLKNECEALFELMYNDKAFSEIIQSNFQLLGFWTSKVPEEYKFEYTLENMTHVLNTRQRWMLSSYYEVNSAHANEILTDGYDYVIGIPFENPIDIALTLRILLLDNLYCNEDDISEYELVSIRDEYAKCVQRPMSFFFKNYDKIPEGNPTPRDLLNLLNFDDATLRQKVAACMQNVDQNELQRQVSKPHGTLEISDLDIKFNENGKLKYLCMPFKTGREITRDTMEEKYMYQLLKPFSHFGENCMVVLITAKKCSQGLETYIQRISSKQSSWRIEVIQYEQLCSLLKLNGQI